jgi:predicted permease
MVGGYVLRKSGLVRAEAAADLSRVVLWLTLPPLILTALHGVRLTAGDLAMPALAWGLSLLALGLGHLLVRVLKLPPARGGAFVLALAFANTTYMGYPIVSGFFPAPAPHLPLAILYDQLGATFAINTLGTAYAGAMAGNAPAPRTLLLQLLRFPPLWGLVLGLALRDVDLPTPLWTLLQGAGALTIPLMLLSMGLSLRFGLWREAGGLVAAVAGIKLVALPLAMFGAVWALGLPTPHAQTAVLQAAMPTMFYTMTLALAVGLDTTLVVNAIVLTTLLAGLTLPLWHHLVL